MNIFFHQLRGELSKLFGKKRTYIGFGTFLLAQNLMLLAFHYTRWQTAMGRMLEGNGYVPTEFITALTVALIMLLPQVSLLMPLYATLVGGDLVAKEAEDGTLRMILSRPISRLRLLFVKWLSGGIFAAVLVISLGAMAVGFALFWFPWGGMFVITPEPMPIFNVMNAADGLRLYALAHIVMALNVCTLLSLAFMFGCFNMKPAAATVLALSFLLLNMVLELIPAFAEYHSYFLTHHLRCWILVFAKPMPLAQIVQSSCVLIGVNITAFIIGATHFQMRDIKS